MADKEHFVCGVKGTISPVVYDSTGRFIKSQYWKSSVSAVDCGGLRVERAIRLYFYSPETTEGFGDAVFCWEPLKDRRNISDSVVFPETVHLKAFDRMTLAGRKNALASVDCIACGNLAGAADFLGLHAESPQILDMQKTYQDYGLDGLNMAVQAFNRRLVDGLRAALDSIGFVEEPPIEEYQKAQRKASGVSAKVFERYDAFTNHVSPPPRAGFGPSPELVRAAIGAVENTSWTIPCPPAPTVDTEGFA